MKIITLFLILFSTLGFSLRCNSQLISVGDPTYIAEKYCANYIRYMDYNQMYVYQNGATYIITSIDRVIYSIVLRRI